MPIFYDLDGYSATIPSGNQPLQVLQQSDFTLLGAFDVPTAVGPSNSPTNTFNDAMSGFSLRYVGGNLQFFHTTNNVDGAQVYEMNYPGVSKTSPPQATVLNFWGNIYNDINGTNQFFIPDNTGWPQTNNYLYGLFYDAAASPPRLYYSYHYNYANAPDDNTDPCFGYSTFNGTKWVSQGCWYLSGVNTQKHCTGVLRIPDSFAAAYTGGRKVGIGFGGQQSGVALASWGPNLWAVKESDIPLGTVQGAVTDSSGGFVMVSGGYGNSSASQTMYTSPFTAQRDTKYISKEWGQVSAATASSVALDNGGTLQAYGGWNAKPDHYDNLAINIWKNADGSTTGGRVGSSTVLTTEIGATNPPGYNVSPNWPTTPQVGDWYEIDYSGNTGWLVNNGVGYWQDNDNLRQGMVWIEGAKKHGVILALSLVKGHYYYAPGGPHMEDVTSQLWVYDPADFAKVAQGTFGDSSTLQAKSQWEIGPSLLPALITTGLDSVKSAGITSACFDPTTATLYVMIAQQRNSGGNLYPRVYAFAVNCN